MSAGNLNARTLAPIGHQLRIRRRRNPRSRAGKAGQSLIERLEPRKLLAAGLVTDINFTGLTACPDRLTDVNGVLYFLADDGVHGMELWKTDGSAAGTVLVKDIYPGATDSKIDRLINLDGTLYFAANDGTNGTQLWKSDGTAAGTQPVKLISTLSSGRISNLTNVGDTLFFTIGVQLWKSNGTAEGTEMVNNFAGTGVIPSNLTAAGTLLYFTPHPLINSALWKSDGTKEGTAHVLQADISNLADVNGVLFFTRWATAGGLELWKSDGTVAGTVRVSMIDRNGTTTPTGLVNVNGVVYFAGADDAHGMELWHSDGTEAGTRMVRDISPGATGSSLMSLTNINGTLYFSALDETNGAELWKSDGTEAGTVLVADINPGIEDSIPSDFVAIPGGFLFSAVDDEHGYELWSSDGTAAGTRLVKDIWGGVGDSYASYLVNSGDATYFLATDEMHGFELWKTDGTEAGTALVKDIYTKTDSSFPSKLLTVNGTTFFVADDGIHGNELWVTDGTAAGTRLLGDIRPGSEGSSIADMISAGGRLYFTADDGIHGRELWRSDGTPEGTFMVKDLNTGQDRTTGQARSSYPTSLIPYGDKLVFVADEYPVRKMWLTDGTAEGTLALAFVGNAYGYASAGPDFVNANGILYFALADANGLSLWKSDRTPKGTGIVKSIAPSSSNASLTDLTPVNDTLFFLAFQNNRYELWKSDGTAAGTAKVKELSTYLGTRPSSFMALNGNLIFTLWDQKNGQELWKSDGTATGTTILKDIALGTGSSDPAYLTVWNGTLYFAAAGRDGDLWKTDGTSSGTVPVADIGPGAVGGPMTSSPAIFNGQLFFTAWTLDKGTELWKTDGTNAGTVMVKDIMPGKASSTIGGFTIVNGTLYFRADDGVHGLELWKTDGTAAGTVLAADINPGPDSSLPFEMIDVNGTPLFVADDGTHGRELWQLIPEVLIGTEGNDRYSVRLDSSGSSIEIYVNCPTGSAPTYVIARDDFQSLVIDAGAGDDTLTIDGSNGPVPTHGILFKGRSGNDTLHIIGCDYVFGTADAAVDTEHLTINLEPGPSPASIVFNATQHLAGLNLGQGCTARLARGEVLVTDSLSIGSAAALDLANHALVVRTLPEHQESVLAAISNAIKLARETGAWTGTGLTSSTARTNKQTGLAVMLNAKSNQALLSQFAGQSVGVNDILVKYTWNGDVNLDGQVDAADYFLVDSGYITQEGQYRNGDLNLDGTVDAADYFLVDSAYIAQTGVMAAKAPSVLQQLFSSKPVL